MTGYKSKEIAFELGIGVDAVNKRLASAKAALGASSRFAAARQLAAWEAGTGGHSLVSQTLAVEAERLVNHPSSRTADEGLNDEHPKPFRNYRVEEPQIPYGATTPAPLLAPVKEEVADFNPRQLVGSPLGTFLICLMAGVLIALLTRL